MTRLLNLGIATVGCLAFFASSGPTAAKEYKYCRRDVTSFMLQCGFETLAQCQDLSFGRGGECYRNPSLGSAAGAYNYAPSVGKTYAYPLHRQR
jgi:hypothetical protein